MKSLRRIGLIFLAVFLLAALMALVLMPKKAKPSVEVEELPAIEALFANEEDIVIDLTERVTTFPSANDKDWGGDRTKSITINGNGNKLFIDDNGIPPIVRAAEGAKIVFNDVTVEGTTNVRSGWLAHDIRFCNETELNNVFFEQEIAFAATGKTMKLHDVTVYTKETLYTVWVCAGTNVEMEGCHFIATTGRGLKVCDEYIENPQLTTVYVKDCVFETQIKAAILVGSAGGARVTLENVDISKVAADDVNAVWTDIHNAESIDKVVVVGGLMRLEPEEVS